MFATSRLRLGRCAVAGAAVHIIGCGASAPPEASVPPSPASEQASSQLSETGEAATLALDPSRCVSPQGHLRPFVVGWDATEQSEFSAHGQRSLMVVKVDGCNLELLPSCQIPGEYRLRTTEGAMQTLSVESEGELYATLPFAIARLSGKVHQNTALDLKYFVRGLKYATAPALYRSDLGAGCEGATHFVLNYAAGAYELSERSGKGAGAGVDVAGAGVGAKGSRSAASSFRGGDMTACSANGTACTAPVRLRLLPIVDAAPAAADDQIRKAALVAPAPADAEAKLTPGVVKGVIRTGFGAIRTCFDEHGAVDGLLLKTKFEIEPDGVVKNVSFVDAGSVDRALARCIAEVFFTLRFPASSKSTAVVYPFQYSSN